MYPTYRSNDTHTQTHIHAQQKKERNRSVSEVISCHDGNGGGGSLAPYCLRKEIGVEAGDDDGTGDSVVCTGGGEASARCDGVGDNEDGTCEAVVD